MLVPVERGDALVQVGLPGGEVLSETPVGEFPHDAAAGPDGRIFVANEFGDTLSIAGNRLLGHLRERVVDDPFAAVERRGPDRKGRGEEVRDRVSGQSVRRRGSLWSRVERRRRTMSARHLEAGAEASRWAVAGLVAGENRRRAPERTPPVR